MSAGSVQSVRDCSPWLVMRAASSKFWMSLLSRMPSSRMPLVRDASCASFATTGASARIDTPPRMEASGVRNSCETEPINASRSCCASVNAFASDFANLILSTK